MNKTDFKSDGLYFSYFNSKDTPIDSSSTHCHDKYEILYVIDGVGKYVVEGIEYKFHPRTLLVIPPYQYHSVKVEDETHYECYKVLFSEQDLSTELRQTFSSLAYDTATFYTPDAVSFAVVSVFERLGYADSFSPESRATYERLLLSELIFLLSTTRREYVIREHIELGAQVVKYINENIGRDITLEHLSKRFFVSKYYLCRAFKKHNGISVHGYINQKRIMYAKQLIDSGEVASSAAYKVGFGDYSAFYRAYVKLLGKSPTARDTERRRDGVQNS